MSFYQWILDCCSETKSSYPFNFLQIAICEEEDEINHFEDVVLVSQALLLMNFTKELAGKLKMDLNMAKYKKVSFKYLTTPGSFHASLFQTFNDINWIFHEANSAMHRIELAQSLISEEVECCLKSIREGRPSTDCLINISGNHIIEQTRKCARICKENEAVFEKTKKVLYELMKGIENYRYEGEAFSYCQFGRRQSKMMLEKIKQKEIYEQQVRALEDHVTRYRQFEVQRTNPKHMVFNLLVQTLTVLEKKGLFSSPNETLLSLGVTVVQKMIPERDWYTQYSLLAIKEAFEVMLEVMGMGKERFRAAFDAMDEHCGMYNIKKARGAMEEFLKYRNEEENISKKNKREEQKEILRNQTDTRLSRNSEDATVAQIIECLRKLYISLTKLQMKWNRLAVFFFKVEQLASKIQIPLSNMTPEEVRKLTAISIETICLCQGIASFSSVFRSLCHKLMNESASADRNHLGNVCTDTITSEQSRLKRKHAETRIRLQEKYETYV